jgi:hypothetical protein
MPNEHASSAAFDLKLLIELTARTSGASNRQRSRTGSPPAKTKSSRQYDRFSPIIRHSPRNGFNDRGPKVLTAGEAA